MVQQMEWYRVFYMTAQCGSFTKAAERMFITQPAVTYAIKQLETKLGGQLFFRTAKGVKLTREGEALFKYVEQAYHFLEAGERKIAEMHQLIEGEVRIGAGDTLCKHLLLPRLRQFHADYPGIRVQVTNRTTFETLALLKEGKIDFGLVNLPVAADPRLVVRELGTLQDCFVAGDTFKQAAAKPLAWNELDRYPVILLEQGAHSRAYFDRIAQTHGVSLKPEFELGSYDLLVDFAVAGFGIACVIRDFVLDRLEKGELHEIKLKPPIPPRGAGIVTLKDVPLPAAATRLIDLLPAARPRTVV